MHQFLLTTDLHQRGGKWEQLVEAAERARPAYILIAGDILPKDGGFARQRMFEVTIDSHGAKGFVC